MMMKALLPIIIIAFIAVTSLNSCVNNVSSDEDETNVSTVTEGETPITFKAKINASTTVSANAATRVTESSFDDGDQVGLFAMIAGTSLDGTRYIDNLLLIANSDGTLTPEKTVYYPIGGYNLDFIAYYPYTTDGVPSGTSTISVSVQTDQSTADGLSLSDFLSASEDNVAGSEDAVTLDFYHRLSRVKVDLIPADGDVDGLLADDPILSAVGFYTAIDYDLEAGTFGDPSAQSGNITLGGSWEAGTDRLTGKEMIVVPQEVTEGEQALTLEWNGMVYNCALSTHTLSTGTQRTVTITMAESSDYELESFVSSIEEWTTVTSQSSSSDATVSYVPVSSLSFAASAVYRIYSGGYPVAEICREYLNGTGISSRATVIYPVVDGETDLTQGTVLELLDVDGDVCGGNVAWSDDYTLAYTAGSSATITRIYIDGDGNICTTQPTTCADVTTTARTLKDTRSDQSQSYAIVKIGAHYWMQENLAATAYADGTALTQMDALGGEAAYFTGDEGVTCFYSGEAVLAGDLAPDGWYIPTSDEWTALETYAGGTAALKTGTWASSGNVSNNVTDVTNLTYFYMLPNGRWTESQIGAGDYATFWALDDGKIPDLVPYFLGDCDYIYWYTPIHTDGTSYKAFSIRCLME